jgi:nucleoside-diphosphate-sugar epimerase
MASREPNAGDLHIPMKLACWLAACAVFAFRLLGRSAPISPYRLRSAYVPLVFDCTKARENLGWQPQVKSAAVLRGLLKA